MSIDISDAHRALLESGGDREAVFAIVGPTAVGKSELAENLAVALGGEIVSADSMQVYRGMDIGTAKAPEADRRVPHHCLDLVDPGHDFSAALYQVASREAIDQIRDRGHVPVLVGGTGLYVRAALDTLDFPRGELTAPLRGELEADAERLGTLAMYERLRELDPDAAALIHQNNIRRIIRALEMVHGGTSYARQAEGSAARDSHYHSAFIGLTLPRLALYERIGVRVDRMLERGLIAEIEELLESGLRGAITASQAIGYKEFIPVIDGNMPLEQAVEQVKQATRRYAKRQLTWFRADERVRWIDVTEMSPERVLDRAFELIESGEPSPYPFEAGE